MSRECNIRLDVVKTWINLTSRCIERLSFYQKHLILDELIRHSTGPRPQLMVLVLHL
jgi:hypothetical protein